MTMAISRAAGFAAALAVLVAAPGAGAQTKGDIDLMTIKTLDCTFSVSAIGSWKGGEPTGTIKSGGTVSVKLEEISAQDGSARMPGNPPIELVLQASVWNLHFLDVERSGRLIMTTVFGQESRNGRLKAVHTRTDYLKISMPNFESEPTASQYYGDCAVGR
jgi:hypothetical protein